MYKLVLMRHGQSLWNLENRFTGWADIDLTEVGKNQAKQAGEILKDHNYIFDIAYSSYLKRSIRTLWIVLDIMNCMHIPIYSDWHLNERHYGNLQGLNKHDIANIYGEKQVSIWRRSYDIAPPSLSINDKRHPKFDIKYQQLPIQLPSTESLKDTIDRVIPFWNNSIVPMIQSGKKVLIVAHGNSLRALIKYITNMSNESIYNFDIPTGKPLVCELNDKMDYIKHYYL
ncbi:2,3-bisphosphoglycerate-dependent phosphoglycerate mutase [Candidatus Kinetoplastibacterium sorsogonicusi]|uniref:2,3-bisphosphoglycerate-dependent phosphoglycerate mutase n=1 Tax=Candidatus Kinetoplastidibacterium kentomonadis TaxID=1576550 RepID=A0A3S7JAL6_9PROT|nr:2,3-diphosphoglycerate-dependent phosphoglycerate mutase [Candidatus Kinetoplastibacterium sorsogonicusi]AWD32709.1 2,3-bisphosphoglycerate-dependent phosphoglycerate mutase [Candidatus Kinetoplastibacterium sorsogonicusi]